MVLVNLNFSTDSFLLGAQLNNFLADGFLTISKQTSTGISQQIVDFLLGNPNSTGLQIGDGVINPQNNRRYTNLRIKHHVGFLLRTKQIDVVTDDGTWFGSVYKA